MIKSYFTSHKFSVTEYYSTTDKQDQNYISDFDKPVKQLKKKT